MLKVLFSDKSISVDDFAAVDGIRSRMSLRKLADFGPGESVESLDVVLNSTACYFVYCLFKKFKNTFNALTLAESDQLIVNLNG